MVDSTDNVAGQFRTDLHYIPFKSGGEEGAIVPDEFSGNLELNGSQIQFSKSLALYEKIAADISPSGYKFAGSFNLNDWQIIGGKFGYDKFYNTDDAITGIYQGIAAGLDHFGANYSDYSLLASYNIIDSDWSSFEAQARYKDYFLKSNNVDRHYVDAEVRFVTPVSNPNGSIDQLFFGSVKTFSNTGMSAFDGNSFFLGPDLAFTHSSNPELSQSDTRVKIGAACTIAKKGALADREIAIAQLSAGYTFRQSENLEGAASSNLSSGYMGLNLNLPFEFPKVPEIQNTVGIKIQYNGINNDVINVRPSENDKTGLYVGLVVSSSIDAVWHKGSDEN